MIIEQLLKEWLAERSSAIDLNVAARPAKAVAGEIEAYYEGRLGKAEAARVEREQLAAEKQRALEKTLEVVTRLEAQVAQVRDKGERMVAERESIIAAKDEAIQASLQLVGRIEAQFGAIREGLEERHARLEKDMEELTRVLKSRDEAIARLEKELAEKTRLVDTYRKKFGVIMKAVG